MKFIDKSYKKELNHVPPVPLIYKRNVRILLRFLLPFHALFFLILDIFVILTIEMNGIKRECKGVLEWGSLEQQNQCQLPFLTIIFLFILIPSKLGIFFSPFEMGKKPRTFFRILVIHNFFISILFVVYMLWFFAGLLSLPNVSPINAVHYLVIVALAYYTGINIFCIKLLK